MLIVGHADADGHLAVEQSRRNTIKMGAESCETLVDTKLTASYRMWRNHLTDIPNGEIDVTIFVDIMLPPDRPADGAEALTRLAEGNPEKTFLFIDHHPVLGLPALPPNLGMWFTSAVYTCCFGSPGPLMVVAAICDRDEAAVVPMLDETMRLRALAMDRAAADRDLAGEKLSRLLAADRWDLIEPLGLEPAHVHRKVRGRRVRQQPVSRGLDLARLTAG